MNDLELEIARQLGASAFLVQQFLKYNTNKSTVDISIETGLSDSCIKMCLNKLIEKNIVSIYKKNNGRYGRYVIYNEVKERETWKFH